MDKHVVQYSGGVGSWAAAKLVSQKHGTENMTLLFADVLAEDEDLYRFLREGADNIGVDITWITEGRTPMQVMSDENFIGNSAKDPCSRILKRRFLDKWCDANLDPASTVRYIGHDWTEINRVSNFQKLMLPWRTSAPLCEAGLSKNDAFAMLAVEGIEAPRLYKAGFSHNNCGGACIKAGQGQWAKLLQLDPDLYDKWEVWEEEMRTRPKVGDNSILRDRRGNKSSSLTLRNFRLRVENKPASIDWLDIGGCGCATA